MGLIKGIRDLDDELAGELLRGIMEAYALIPFAAVLVSSAFGAVSIAWDSARRATRSMGALFLCTGLWALIDLFTYVETEHDRAFMWMRWSHVPLLLLGPCVIWVLAELLPEASTRLRRRAAWSAAFLLPVGIVAAVVPGSLLGLEATEYGGWMPVYGPVSAVLIPLAMILPIYAGFEARRVPAQQNQEPVDERRVWALRVCLLACMLVALPTEYLLPLMQIPVPRLGAFVVAMFSVLAWLHVLHESDDLAVTPQGVARGVLGELRDGVALVRLDGTVLSTNARFCEMTGRNVPALLGTPLDSLTDVPIERIRIGLRDYKANLHSEGGEAVPVSLSSSVAQNRTGVEIGLVVVFRDLREVDRLRNQLMNSGRLAAIGELAAGIAHEVNNPVAFIRADLNFLAERIAEIREQLEAQEGFDHEVRLFDRSARRVAAALEGIERVTQVVGDVREFAHLGGSGQGGSDPELVVDGAIRLARLQRGSDVELRITTVAGSERFDSGQELKQILLALLRVLVEATEKGGRIEADLRTDALELAIGLSAGPLAESATLTLERFEILSHEMREGAPAEFGLGVATELVARLGGRIGIEAEGAQGVRLELSVPLVAQERAS